MPSTFDRYDLDGLMKSCENAIQEINPDDLAFLLATGKSELEIRNQIALHLNRNRSTHQTVAREWIRHDLALFEDGLPAFVIEGKSWLHADAVNEKKLLHGSKSIKHGIESDVKKLKKSANQFPHLATYISMLNFSIDVRELDLSSLRNAEIKYQSTHLKGLQDFRTLEDLAGHGRSRVSNLLSEYGVVRRTPLFVTRYLGMSIEADFYLVQIPE
jgi:hypothetical protein